MKRFVIIGLGNFGSSVAEALYAQGHEVIAVDQNEDAVDRISPRVSKAVAGDGRNMATLERIGAKNADYGIVSTGDDITSSILATLALRDLSVPCAVVLAQWGAKQGDKPLYREVPDAATLAPGTTVQRVPGADHVDLLWHPTTLAAIDGFVRA